VRAAVIAGIEDGIVPRPDADLGEERRLLYVAMTRAKEFLFCTWAGQRRGPTARPGRARVRARRQHSHFFMGGPVQSQDGLTFLAFTFRAHLESAYARAARIFDRTPGTATIPSMLGRVELKAGTFQFATAAEIRKKLIAWEKRIANVQLLPAKLSDLRNGLIAHLDRKVILDPKEMSRTIGVTFDEIDQVLDVAKEVLTSVLDAYNKSIYVDELLSGDYEALFRILEESTRESIGEYAVKGR
jgi:hypothetical protein